MSATIAVDVRVLGEEHTGVATYTRSLLTALAVERPDTEWLLFSHRTLKNTAVWGEGVQPRWHPRIVPFPAPMVVRPIWDHVLIPPLLRLAAPDLWFSPLSITPAGLGRIPSVVTIHDLAFMKLPGIQPAKYSAAWSHSLKRAARKATHAICVSESTRRDFLELPGAGPERVSVIHEGVDLERFQPGGCDDDARLKELNIEPGYLLAVGTLEPRKNYSFLLDCYEELSRSGDVPPLLIVGGEGWSSADVKKRIEGMAPRVRRLGYIEHHLLPVLYRQASALVFPTLYEGFGLPVLEALASGTSVLASDLPVCREVGGDAAYYAAPNNCEAWISAIWKIVKEPPAKEFLRCHAESFTWQKSAHATWAVFDQCMGG